MKLIRLDSYKTKRGDFEVWYDSRRDVIVQTGRDDLGHTYEDESPAAEFIEDLQDEQEGECYLAALIESLQQNNAEIMVQWGVSIEAWEQARQRGDFSGLRATLKN